MKRAVLTAAILLLLNAGAVQAEIIPPYGEGQIGLEAVVLCEELTVREMPSASSKAVQTLKYGRRFAVQPDDEYTISSGAIIGQAQYIQWHDLTSSRQVEVLWGNRWIPVTITRANYERTYSPPIVDSVTFSFKMANKKIVI